MNGITILSTKDFYTAIWPTYIVIIIMFVAIIAITYMKIKDKIPLSFILPLEVFALVISIILAAEGTLPSKKLIHKVRTEYKVTINDDVKFHEFHNKYEIVDKEGDIYTVKEKK